MVQEAAFRPTSFVPLACTTTCVSAGDAGAGNFAAFRRFIVAGTRTRLYAFVHIANIGLTSFPIAELPVIDFADVDAATFALSAATTAAALTPRTAAVVIVHIGGLISPGIDEVRALCDERGVALVEDAAHAHGSTFDGRFAGSFGAAAAFSLRAFTRS